MKAALKGRGVPEFEVEHSHGLAAASVFDVLRVSGTAEDVAREDRADVDVEFGHLTVICSYTRMKCDVWQCAAICHFVTSPPARRGWMGAGARGLLLSTRWQSNRGLTLVRHSLVCRESLAEVCADFARW